MTEYTTRDGDSLDAICHHHYGQEHGTTEIVLEHNQGVAKYGAVLPAGITIILPELYQPTPEIEQVSLWD